MCRGAQLVRAGSVKEFFEVFRAVCLVTVSSIDFWVHARILRKKLSSCICTAFVCLIGAGAHLRLSVCALDSVVLP